MRNVISIIFCTLFLAGCFQKANHEKIKTGNDDWYKHYILNIAMSNPDYNCDRCLPDAWNVWAKDITKIKRKAIDKDNNVEMNLHQWTYDGGQSFPKSIIYVSGINDYGYAFPFYDEYFYYGKYSPTFLEHNDSENHTKLTFETHLNYVISKLGYNNIEDKKIANEFLTLFADSLLGLKEITLNDTTELKNYFAEILNDTSYFNEICTETVQENINLIIKSLYKDDTRIFTSFEGSDGYWKFTFITKGGKLYIKPTFENEECYSCMFW